MALIILSWIYIAFIFFSLGIAFAAFVNKRLLKLSDVSTDGQEFLPISFLLVSGLIITETIGSILSLFVPLSYGVNIFLLLLSVGCLLLNRRSTTAYLLRCKTQLGSTHIATTIFFIASVFVFAHLSAQQSSHFDDGLYYSTTIKWIEEYGVVKGIGNINPRIGYNSNWHLLNALFSFSYFNLGNFNDLNGLLLLLILPYSLGGLNQVIKGKYDIINITRSFFMLPLLAFHFGASSDFIFYNINFLSSSTPDLAVCLLIWTVTIWLFELDFIKSPGLLNRQIIYICLVACFLFAVKPSAIPLLITVIWFFFLFLKKKQFLLSGIIMTTALIVIVPWLIRNVIITGYLVFPFSSIDIFNVDWKVHATHAQWHENAVKVYAISPEYDLNKPFLIPLSSWFPVWFARLNFIQSLFFIGSALSILGLGIFFLINIATKGKVFFLNNTYRIFTFFIIVCGITFWFIKAPDFRFGYGFLSILCSLSIALVLKYFLENGVKYFGYLITAAIGYILFFYYKPVWKALPDRFFKKPAERRMPEKFSVISMGENAEMKIVPYGTSWYAPLPVANDGEFQTVMPMPRGTSIKDGFKPSIKSPAK